MRVELADSQLRKSYTAHLTSINTFRRPRDCSDVPAPAASWKLLIFVEINRILGTVRNRARLRS